MATRRTRVVTTLAAAGLSLSLGLAGPATARHAAKHCDIGLHNDIQPAAVTAPIPDEVADVVPEGTDIGLGQGRVQVGVACSTHDHGKPDDTPRGKPSDE